MTSRGQRPNSPKNSGGAGDAFLAGLAYAWLHDWPLEKTLTFALAAADITLTADSASSPALSVPAIEAVIRRER